MDSRDRARKDFDEYQSALFDLLHEDKEQKSVRGTPKRTEMNLRMAEQRAEKASAAAPRIPYLPPPRVAPPAPPAPAVPKVQTYKALHDYTPNASNTGGKQEFGKLSLTKGELVVVLRKAPFGWFLARRQDHSETGWAPSSHLQELRNATSGGDTSMGMDLDHIPDPPIGKRPSGSLSTLCSSFDPSNSAEDDPEEDPIADLLAVMGHSPVLPSVKLSSSARWRPDPSSWDLNDSTAWAKARDRRRSGYRAIAPKPPPAPRPSHKTLPSMSPPELIPGPKGWSKTPEQRIREDPRFEKLSGKAKRGLKGGIWRPADQGWRDRNLSRQERKTGEERFHQRYRHGDPDRLWELTLENSEYENVQTAPKDPTSPVSVTSLPPQEPPKNEDIPGEPMEDVQSSRFANRDVRGPMPNRTTEEAECPDVFEVEGRDSPQISAESSGLSSLSSSPSPPPPTDRLSLAIKGIIREVEFQRLRTEELEAERAKRTSPTSIDPIQQQIQADQKSIKTIQETIQGFEHGLASQDLSTKGAIQFDYIRQLQREKALLLAEIEDCKRQAGKSDAIGDDGYGWEHYPYIHSWKIDDRRWLAYHFGPLDSEPKDRKWVRAAYVDEMLGMGEALFVNRVAEFKKRCSREVARMARFCEDKPDRKPHSLSQKNKVPDVPDPFWDTKEIVEKRENRQRAMAYWNAYKSSVVGAQFAFDEWLYYLVIDAFETEPREIRADFLAESWNEAIDAFMNRKHAEWTYDLEEKKAQAEFSRWCNPPNPVEEEKEKAEDSWVQFSLPLNGDEVAERIRKDSLYST